MAVTDTSLRGSTEQSPIKRIFRFRIIPVVIFGFCALWHLGFGFLMLGTFVYQVGKGLLFGDLGISELISAIRANQGGLQDGLIVMIECFVRGIPAAMSCRFFWTGKFWLASGCAILFFSINYALMQYYQ